MNTPARVTAVLVWAAAIACGCSSTVVSQDGGDAIVGGDASDVTVGPDVVGGDAGDVPIPIDTVGRVPRRHRPAPEMCVRPPPLPDGGTGSDAGLVDGGRDQCMTDGDCSARLGGHCVSSRVGRICTYDACWADSDCMGGACVCAGGSLGSAGANVCLAGNCRVDSDCGAGGYCSPTYDTMCGPYSGFRGYYCHTPMDSCLDDEDCRGDAGMGYCARQPTTGAWACSYSWCAG